MLIIPDLTLIVDRTNIRPYSHCVQLHLGLMLDDNCIIIMALIMYLYAYDTVVSGIKQLN